MITVQKLYSSFFKNIDNLKTYPMIQDCGVKLCLYLLKKYIDANEIYNCYEIYRFVILKIWSAANSD